MDLFKFALQMERDGETYYRRLAAGCPSKGIAAICTLLANEEVSHQRALVALQESYAPYLPVSTLVEEVRNVFDNLMARGQPPAPDLPQLDLYRHAQDLERQSREFYLEHADDAEPPEFHQAFMKLADEELRHHQILEDLIEFISRPLPGRWLENAEWNHREDY